MYVGGGVDVVEDGEVVTRMVAGMVTGDIVRVEGAGPRLMVVAGLGGDGVGVVWWKNLLVEVVLEKVKGDGGILVEFWSLWWIKWRWKRNKMMVKCCRWW